MVKQRSMIILEVNVRKKVSCVFKIVLDPIAFFEPSVIITLLLLLECYCSDDHEIGHMYQA